MVPYLSPSVLWPLFGTAELIASVVVYLGWEVKTERMYSGLKP